MKQEQIKSYSAAEGVQDSAVRHNEADQRFEMDTRAGLAVVDYRRTGDTLILYHTEVPYSLRGRGIGERLVRGTLEEVRRLGLKVVPRCWFVGEVIERRAGYRDLLAARPEAT